jgi:hypothetical protein
MEDRKVELAYKNIIIYGYKGSNWAYVGNRTFSSVLAAKRHITKALKHFNNNPELTWKFYTGE